MEDILATSIWIRHWCVRPTDCLIAGYNGTGDREPLTPVSLPYFKLWSRTQNRRGNASGPDDRCFIVGSVTLYYPWRGDLPGVIIVTGESVDGVESMNRSPQPTKGRMIYTRPDEETHRRLKISAAQRGITIQQTVESLIHLSVARSPRKSVK